MLLQTPIEQYAQAIRKQIIKPLHYWWPVDSTMGQCRGKLTNVMTSSRNPSFMAIETLIFFDVILNKSDKKRSSWRGTVLRCNVIVMWCSQAVS